MGQSGGLYCQGECQQHPDFYRSPLSLNMNVCILLPKQPSTQPAYIKNMLTLHDHEKEVIFKGKSYLLSLQLYYDITIFNSLSIIHKQVSWGSVVET